MERKGLPLKTKIICLIPIVSMVMWMAVIFHNFNLIENSLNENANAELSLWIRKIKDFIVDDLKTGNYAGLRRNLRRVVEENILGYVEFHDQNGTLLFTYPESRAAGRDGHGQTSPLHLYHEIDFSRYSSAEYVYAVRDHLGVAWGQLVFRLPEKGYAIAIERQKKRSLLFGLGILLIELGFFILVVNKMFAPLERMSENINQIANRLPEIDKPLAELRAAVDQANSDEITLLGKQILGFIERMRDYRVQNERLSALAAIGNTTSMVAHDIRKPLASMKALLYSLQWVKDDPEQILRMISVVDANIARTNALLNDILEFSRDATALELRSLDPQSVVAASLSDALRGRSGLDVHINYQLEHRNYLKIDGHRMMRALTNILSNAVEALEGKGRIWIKTRDLPAEPGAEAAAGLAVGQQPSLFQGQRMQITIGNDGPMIPTNVQQQLFGPFFSHGKKGGTGLGLSICQKIVEMHGGRIWFYSRPHCTEFTMELPAVEGQLTPSAAELIHHSSELWPFEEEAALRVAYSDTTNATEFMRRHRQIGRSLTLIVADDEPLFRETIRTLLQGIPQVCDHVRVIEADSAEACLELMRGQSCDYLIADLELGQSTMNGYELASTALARYPQTLVLIHSNKRREEMDEQIRALNNQHFMGFVPKPIKQQELLQFLAGKTFEKTVSPGERVKKKVLLVNDDRIFLLSCRTMVDPEVTCILEATTVEQAMSHFSNAAVDLIISDINLGPGQPDGYTLLRQVREKTESLPFYLVSGYSRQEEEEKARKLGANGYYQLPLEPEQLNMMIMMVAE